MWDSKWTHSSQTQQVLYNGQSLFSDRTYYWKVCIKDEQSKISAWSEPNTFTTGFFEHNEWLDQWILGHGQNAREWEHKANAAAGAIHRKFLMPAITPIQMAAPPTWLWHFWLRLYLPRCDLK